MINGWFNLYKPQGYTSTYCLNLIKKRFNLNKIGHIGTLDPMAEGVLPIAINEATKTISYINKNKKTYLFEVKWGSKTDTMDSDGEIIDKIEFVPEKKKIEKAIKCFVGTIEQLPPKFSAKKINGKRAYQLARARIKFELGKIKKKIYGIKIVNHSDRDKKTTFLTVCESGTYVRSLSQDISNKLNSMCYCSKILRLRDGFFSKNNALPLEKVLNFRENDEFFKYLLDIKSVLYHIPSIKINDKKLKLIKNGMKVSMLEEVGSIEHKKILADYHENVVALGSMQNGIFYPKRVLNINE